MGLRNPRPTVHDQGGQALRFTLEKIRRDVVVDLEKETVPVGRHQSIAAVDASTAQRNRLGNRSPSPRPAPLDDGRGEGHALPPSRAWSSPRTPASTMPYVGSNPSSRPS